MTSIEERLTRDVAVVRDGVHVSESDLQAARTAVDARASDRRQHGRRLTVAAAAVVVGALAGVAAFDAVGAGDTEPAAPADPGPTVADPDAAFLTGDVPTAEALEGLWRVDNGTVLLDFGEDGTVRFDDRGTLFSDPVASGTYELDGDLITVSTTESERARCTGEVILRASLAEAGSLRFVVSAASSGVCSLLPPGHQVLEQVLPTRNEALAELVFSQDRGWRPLSDTDTLHGVWQAEGGGHVLELDPGGSYYVADQSGGPIDRGHWSVRGSNLTLTSSSQSGVCNEGDRLVLGGVAHIDPGTSAIRGTVEQNSCGGAWTPAAWILIPHAGTWS